MPEIEPDSFGDPARPSRLLFAADALGFGICRPEGLFQFDDQLGIGGRTEPADDFALAIGQQRGGPGGDAGGVEERFGPFDVEHDRQLVCRLATFSG